MKNIQPAPSENASKENPRIMPIDPEWIRAESQLLSDVPALPNNGIDRKNAVIHGYIVALEGPLKSKRGEFDELSLNQMAEVINSRPNGIKVRFTHPSLSDDGLGTFLGRSRNGRVESVITERDGVKSEKLGLRADLHFDKTAMDAPPKGGGTPLGLYIMNLAESDPEALSSSVVIPYSGLKEEYRTDSEGNQEKDEQGRFKPPLWRITNLHASDIVDSGDAVDGLLSSDLPDTAVRLGCDLLDRVFGGQPAEVTRSRALAWLDRYIALRYPGESLPGDEIEDMKNQLGIASELLASKDEVIEALKKEINGLRDENQRQDVERIFDQELTGYIYPGERPKLFAAALKMRSRGDAPDSEFRIFIESLKARGKKKIDTKEIAGDVGHSIVIDVTPADKHEEKREVSGYLMP